MRAATVTLEEFADGLKKGLGRTLIWARNQDRSRFVPLILAACLSDPRYDSQWESSRAPYCAELAESVGIADDLPAAIEQALPGMESGLDRRHALRILVYLAKRGHTAAIQTLKDTFLRSETPAEDGVFVIDGLGEEGFWWMLEARPNLAEQAEDRQCRSLLLHLEDATGEDWKILHARLEGFEQAALICEKTRQFLRPSPKVEKPSSEPLTADQLLSSDVPLFAYTQWGEKASDEELEIVAKSLLYETDRKRARSLRWTFRRRAFPLVEEAIHRIKYDPLGSWQLISTLSDVRHDGVRALALELLDKPQTVVPGLMLLRKNFDREDWSRVIDAIRSVPRTDEVAIHGSSRSVLAIWDKARLRAGLQALVWVYERTPCSFCREGAFRELAKSGANVSQLAAEAIYDSEPDTRALAQEWQAKRDEPRTQGG